MKDRFSCLLIFVLGLTQLHAQNYLLNEDFSSVSGKTLPSGWKQTMLTGVSGDDDWTFGKHPKFYFAPPFDEKYATFDSYNGGSVGGTATNGQPETVVLESPIISTKSVNNLFFSFDYMELSNGGSAQLELSVDSGQNWTTYATYSAITSSPVTILYDLSTYTNYKNFKLRFKWHNPNTANYQGYFAVDNVKLFSRHSIDATVVALNPMYDKSCPNAAQAIYVIVKNEGTSTLNNIPIIVKVSGAISKTLNKTYTTALTSGATATVYIDTINTNVGGTFQFNAQVDVSGDANSGNNSFSTSRSAAAISGNPAAIDGSACLRGNRVSIGVNKTSGDSTFWYDQPSGGNLIGSGTPFLTPSIDTTTLFYAQNAKLFDNNQWTFQGPYRFNGIQYSGSYFDLNTVNEILIDSFYQHFAYSGNYEVSIYYKSGTYSGFESSSSAWTFHEKVSVSSTGYGHMVVLKLSKPINVPAGQTYGLYLLADGLATNKSITFKAGSTQFTNSDFSLSSAVVSNSSFGPVNGYSWDGRVFFRKLCLSNRVAVKAVIKPGPTGASLIKGSTFNGRFDFGTISEPDLMQIGQTANYELIPPTGYKNKDFGTTWKLNNLLVKTNHGYTLPIAEYSYTQPSVSGGNLNFTFKSLAKYLDSTLVLTINFSDLVTNLCDSTVKRYFKIVPTPKVNFQFNNPACEGSPIVFENKSTIHSGSLTYVWHFGDGDTSDYESVGHVYPKYGKYCVKLIATSLKYKISHDTTICLTIFEKPKTTFKVLNACEGEAISFLNQTKLDSGTLKFNWNFGDGSAPSQLENPKYTYSKAGGFKVTLTATSDKNCTQTFSRNANQFVKPKADFTFKGTCSYDTTWITSLATIAPGDKFGDTWNFGDGTGNNQRNPYHVYTTPGIKFIKYKTISQFGCIDSIIKSIDVLPAPVASFENGPACNVTPVIFDNQTFMPSGIKSVIYFWNFGDDSTGTTINPEHHYPDLGRYTITLKAVGDNGCSTYFYKQINVLLQPIAGFNAHDVCAGQDVILSNKTKGGGQISFKWKFGDGDSSSLFNPIKRYATTTTATYNITLTASTLGGCKNSSTVPVTVNQLPVCGFTFTSALTGGYEYIFTPTVSTYPFYQWTFEGGGTSNSNRPKHKFPMDGKYLVKLYTKSIDGCECMDTGRYVIVGHTGIKPSSNTLDIAVFPNPSKGEFTLQLPFIAQNEAYDLNVIESSGKLIFTNRFTGNSLQSIYLSQFANGIYTLEIIRDSGEKLFKKLYLAK